MACTLTIGRAEQCKDSVGGLLAVYAIPFNGISYWRGGSLVSPRNAADDQSIQVLAIKTELHGNNTLDSEIISSRNEGTTYERQTLVLNLKGSDVELYRMLRNSSDRYYFAVVTRDLPNEYRLIGTNQANTVAGAKMCAKGAEISQIQTVSGSSLGDFVGATVTITAEVPCGELDREIGYGKANYNYLTIFDPKQTYETWIPEFNISSNTTTIGDSQSIDDGHYYNPSTGEVFELYENNDLTYELERGLMGTYAMDISTEHILHKIS